MSFLHSSLWIVSKSRMGSTLSSTCTTLSDSNALTMWKMPANHVHKHYMYAVCVSVTCAIHSTLWSRSTKYDAASISISSANARERQILAAIFGCSTRTVFISIHQQLMWPVWLLVDAMLMKCKLVPYKSTRTRKGTIAAKDEQQLYHIAFRCSKLRKFRGATDAEHGWRTAHGKQFVYT